jgi:hypothetical protein
MHTEVNMLNQLELKVLEHIAQSNHCLNNLIGNLRVSERKFTGCGSYTDFETASAAINIPNDDFTLDALISMPDIKNGMGATLFVKDNYISFLEIYVFGGEPWDGTFENFSLVNNA